MLEVAWLLDFSNLAPAGRALLLRLAQTAGMAVGLPLSLPEGRVLCGLWLLSLLRNQYVPTEGISVYSAKQRLGGCANVAEWLERALCSAFWGENPHHLVKL